MDYSNTFQDLQCWNKAHDFVLQTYKITAFFPKAKIDSLTSQFRRAATTIPANIAAGYKKTGIKDKLRFFNMAQGRLEECRYYIMLSKDLNSTEIDAFDLLNHILIDVSRLLNAYCNKINQFLHLDPP